MKKNIPFLIGTVGIFIFFLSISPVKVMADYKYDYYDYDGMVTLLEDLETQSSSKTPDVFLLQIIGYSHQGNPIHAVKFSDNPDQEEDDEPDVLIDPGLHGNEWLPMESNMNFIQYLFDVYYDDQHADYAEVQDLVNNFEIWIIPVINVDGRIRDDLGGGDPENFWTDTSYHAGDAEGWRMNVQEVNCPAKPGGVNIGIDLNRSWSRRFWEDSNCAANYHGEAPFDPTETKVLKQFINNHMVSLVFHQHSALNSIFSNSGTIGLGDYITVEMDAAYEEEGLLDPLLALTNAIEREEDGGGLSGSEYIKESDTTTGSFLAGACNGMFMTGQYFNWLWYEIDCPLSSDHGSWRAIQCVFYEYPTKEADYGHPDEGKIGQHQQGDASNYFHPSSGDVNTWVISRSIEMNKYLIKQSKYPFSPRYHTDMSRKPEAPTTDLAIVGAKISEVGTGLPGSFTYDSNGRDLLEPGTKRITWNVQNNGTSNRTINSQITICNLTDDPTCLSTVTDILTRNNVTPETIETFTYDYAFEPCKDYAVTLTTGESNSYLNDTKIFIFTTISSCKVDFEPDGDVDGTDAYNFKTDFGRMDCSELTPCNGNSDCDTDVDGSDAFMFKQDFGRMDCPACLFSCY